MSHPNPDPMDFDNLSLADLFAILDNTPIVFWTCPKGCRGPVEWTADCSDARCLECGTRRSDAPAHVHDPEAAQ